MKSELLPRHVAIIMDGNGRWATAKGLSRSEGHHHGLQVARDIAGYLAKRGLPFLSYYIFSTENWKRSQEEVAFLFDLLKKYLKEELSFCMENNIRVVHSGDIDSLPIDVQKEIESICDKTKTNKGLVINMAINYGGQDEIIRAFKRYESQKDKVSLTVENFSSYLDTPFLPPVDLVIRTSGEQRFSNFLLWQSSYAEFFFTQKNWPEFSGDDLEEAFRAYSHRNRRFGGYSQ